MTNANTLKTLKERKRKLISYHKKVIEQINSAISDIEQEEIDKLQLKFKFEGS